MGGNKKTCLESHVYETILLGHLAAEVEAVIQDNSGEAAQTVELAQTADTVSFY